MQRHAKESHHPKASITASTTAEPPIHPTAETPIEKEKHTGEAPLPPKGRFALESALESAPVKFTSQAQWVKLAEGWHFKKTGRGGASSITDQWQSGMSETHRRFDK